jgi:RimJ/RimL family protein N-acetyltransferase
MLTMKPSHPGTVFTKHFPELSVSVSFRSLHLKADLPILHRWVNASYAKKFWQLEGDEAFLHKTYAEILEHPHTHAFISLGNDQPFCLIEVYALHTEQELLQQIPTANPNDCGVHLLMCPPRELKKGWSAAALLAFQQYYFSFPNFTALYAEPDHQNVLANRLAIQTGFRFIKTINLSYKTANLYHLTRKDFP